METTEELKEETWEERLKRGRIKYLEAKLEVLILEIERLKAEE